MLRFATPPVRQAYTGFGAVLICDIAPNPECPMRLKPGALIDAIGAIMDESSAIAQRTGGFLEAIQGTTAVFYWPLVREAVDYAQVYAGLRELQARRDASGGTLRFHLALAAQEIVVQANRTSAQRELHLTGEAYDQAKRLLLMPSKAFLVIDELTASLIQADDHLAIVAEFGIEVIRGVV